MLFRSHHRTRSALQRSHSPSAGNGWSQSDLELEAPARRASRRCEAWHPHLSPSSLPRPWKRSSRAPDAVKRGQRANASLCLALCSSSPRGPAQAIASSYRQWLLSTAATPCLCYVHACLKAQPGYRQARRRAQGSFYKVIPISHPKSHLQDTQSHPASTARLQSRSIVPVYLHSLRSLLNSHPHSLLCVTLSPLPQSSDWRLPLLALLPRRSTSTRLTRLPLLPSWAQPLLPSAMLSPTTLPPLLPPSLQRSPMTPSLPASDP